MRPLRFEALLLDDFAFLLLLAPFFLWERHCYSLNWNTSCLKKYSTIIKVLRIRPVMWKAQLCSHFFSYAFSKLFPINGPYFWLILLQQQLSVHCNHSSFVFLCLLCASVHLLSKWPESKVFNQISEICISNQYNKKNTIRDGGSTAP